jgi:hypothetical protein
MAVAKEKGTEAYQKNEHGLTGGRVTFDVRALVLNWHVSR